MNTEHRSTSSIECDNALIVVVNGYRFTPFRILEDRKYFTISMWICVGCWGGIEIYQTSIDSLVGPMNFVIRMRAWYIVVSQESLSNGKKTDRKWFHLAGKVELVNLLCKMNEWLSIMS